MDYGVVYPWAKCDVLRETSDFTSVKRVESFPHAQALSYSGLEANIVVVPCAPNEPICRDCQNGESFCFFYETFFNKLGVRLPLTSFEKEILNVMNIAPAQLHPNS